MATFQKQVKDILNKYNFEKTDSNGNWLDKCYSHKVYLNNLNTYWYIDIENKTRRCGFYSVFTRFGEDMEYLNELNKVIPCNTYSGKCNAFVYSVDEIECFINNIITFNKLFEKDVA